MTHRRAFLKQLGTTGLAIHVTGCLSVSSSTESPNTPPDDSSSTTSGTSVNTDTSDVQRRITLAEQDSVPQQYGVRMEVKVLHSTVTPQRTARLRVTMINIGARRSISFSGDSMCSLFNRGNGGSDSPRGLWLYSPSDAKDLERQGDKWRIDASPTDGRGYGAYGCGGSILPRNASISNEYLVWDDFQIEGYMIPGVYRFEESILISPASENRSQTSRETGEAEEPDPTPTLRPTFDSDQIEFTWGFSLEISR